MVKMRKSKGTVCSSCGCGEGKCLNLFEVSVGEGVENFVLCDFCMEELLNKSLHAVCFVNGRIKTEKEIRIKNERTSRERKKKEKGD